jgi:hypothetical protein
VVPDLRRDPRRSRLVALAAIFLLSLVLQFAYGHWVQPRNRAAEPELQAPQPVASPFHGDEKEYYWIAANLLSGRGYDQGAPGDPARSTAARPPGYPLLLAGLFAVAGPNLDLGLALNRLLAALTVLAAYGVAQGLWAGDGALRPRRELSSGDPPEDPRVAWRAHRAGLVAAVLTAVWPHGLYFAGNLMTESMVALLYTLALLTAVRMAQRPTGRRAAAAGGAWGATLLVHSAFLPQILALGAWFVLARRRIPRRSMAMFAIVVALLCGPWVLRNWITFGRPILTTTGSGMVFAGAHRPDVMADSPGSWKHPEGPPSGEFQGKRFDPHDELQADRYFWHQGREHLAQLDVMGGLRLAAYKVARMFVPIERLVADSVCPACNVGVTVLFLPVFALIPVGLWFLRSRPLLFALLALQAAALLATAVVFWGGTRLRMPMEPGWWAIAAFGATAWIERRSAATR